MIQGPVPKMGEVRSQAKKDKEIKVPWLSRIEIAGKSRQAVFPEAEKTITFHPCGYDEVEIGQLYRGELAESGWTLTVSKGTPVHLSFGAYSSSFEMALVAYVKKRDPDTGKILYGTQQYGLIDRAGANNEYTSFTGAAENLDIVLLSDNVKLRMRDKSNATAFQDIDVRIRRDAVPSADIPQAFYITDAVKFSINGEPFEIACKLRSSGTDADKFVLDLENREMYILRKIKVLKEETETASIFDGYEAMPEAVKEGLEWDAGLDRYCGRPAGVSNGTEIFTDAYVYYHEYGIQDGMPPVRDGLVSVFDGYNNSGRSLRKGFHGWQDILGRSTFGTRDFRGYTPLGDNGLHLSGNTSAADLAAKMRLDIVEFTDMDLNAEDGAGQQAGKVYKEPALWLDAHGMLGCDAEGNYLVRKGLTFPAYSYLKGHSKGGEGYCTISLPAIPGRGDGTTVMVVTRLTDPQDDYFIHPINGGMGAVPDGCAMEPYKDYALRINNLEGVTHLFINSLKVWEGTYFNGDVRYIGNNPVYTGDADIPYSLGIGFCRDPSKDGDGSIYRDMEVYAVYIYGRELSPDEATRNMEYAGQRFGYPAYQAYFPKLNDGGACSTLEDALAYTGYRKGPGAAGMEAFIPEIGILNMEHRTYRELFSDDFNIEMLRLMRAGKLKRPTAWDARRERYGVEL